MVRVMGKVVVGLRVGPDGSRHRFWDLLLPRLHLDTSPIIRMGVTVL